VIKLREDPTTSINQLYGELEAKSHSLISQGDNRGPNAIMIYDVNIVLKAYKIRFQQLVKESVDENMKFLENLTQTKLENLHDIVLVKLDTILAQILQTRQKESILSGMNLSTKNKKLMKRKLAKKRK